ncbi:MAG: DUF2283 domain-containing protein [Candidatus Nanopelagicales bacterium]
MQFEGEQAHVLTYDNEADAAYIALAPETASDTQHVVSLPSGHELVLDLDVNGRLVGIEILAASSVLIPGTLGDSSG